MTKTFPELLKKYRKEKNLSQAAFAKEIGISQSMVAWYEVGKHKPTTEDYPMFAKLLKISVVELISILHPVEECDDYDRFLVQIDMNVPIDELRKTHELTLDGVELTEEEYKEAIETIRFNRFKKSNQ